MPETAPAYCARCDSTGLIPLIEEREGLKYEVSYRCSCPWGERRWTKVVNRKKGGTYVLPLFDDQPGTQQFESRNAMQATNLRAWHSPEEIQDFRRLGLRLAKGAIPPTIETELRRRWKLPHAAEKKKIA